jgi:Bacterial transcriptional activator domain
MLVLAALGQHAEALRVFDAVRARLCEDLGADPDPVLRDAHARVLAQDVPAGVAAPAPSAGPARLVTPAPAPVSPSTRVRAPASPVPGHGRPDDPSVPRAPHQLPGRPALVTGRQDDLLRIVLALGQPGRGGAAVVTVGGLPGVGKSALAVAAAHQAAAAFPDGELYASLGGSGPGLPPPAPADVLRGFLHALDPAAPATRSGYARSYQAQCDQAVLGQYRSLTAGRRLLVVLDGAHSAAQVRPLLPTGTGCAALITSQEALTSLDATATVELRPLALADALDLLAGLTAAGPAWESAAAAEICAACGGLPLALRIVAAQLASRPAWSMADAAIRLRPEATRLAVLAHGDLSVSASIQASYDALRRDHSPAGPQAARAFLRLAAADGLPLARGIVLGQAAAVLGEPPARCEAALERLADAHLLDTPAPGRYQMHPLLRLAARELPVRTARGPGGASPARPGRRRAPGQGQVA